jgi:hypothetical protein
VLHTVEVIAFHALILVAGAACFVIGLRSVWNGYPSSDSFEYKELKVAGTVVLILLGLACMVFGFSLQTPGQPPPRVIKVRVPGPTVTVSADPNGGTGETPTPVGPQKVFKTPRGVVCSTYLDGSAMGCVVTEHKWPFKGCQYLFTLSKSGSPVVDKCPSARALSRLYEYPAQDRAASRYGSRFHLAGVTCTMHDRFTKCTNVAGGYFKVSAEKHDHS